MRRAPLLLARSLAVAREEEEVKQLEEQVAKSEGRLLEELERRKPA